MTTNTASGICVPLEEQEPNEVDGMMAKIREIQNACSHDFKLTKEVELKESLVPNVFVGFTQGPISDKILDHGEIQKEFTIVCTKCSEEVKYYIPEVCPRCLGQMSKPDLEGGRNSRERFFGMQHHYYAVTLSFCKGLCGFVVASDVWDQ